MDKTQLSLLADLCMVAQGFRPGPKRTVELVSQGYLWVSQAKPPEYGMTSQGKAALIDCLFEAADTDADAMNLTARGLTPTAAEFYAGCAFLDEVESRARSGEIVSANEPQQLFILWLLRRLPSVPGALSRR